jgi:RHS repeat-associated protein
MPMPNRNVEGQYPYAFQGQEKDLETGMEAFELRLWDARIGRWLTTDPYGQYFSPYLGMGNDPINGIDPDGGFTKFGAWWFKLWNGGETIHKDNGTYAVVGFEEGNGASIAVSGSALRARSERLATYHAQTNLPNYAFHIGNTPFGATTKLKALAGPAEFALPSAKFSGLSKIFSKTPEEIIVSQLPKTVNEAAQARHVVGSGFTKPIRQNSAAGLITENVSTLMKNVHGNNIRSLEIINNNKLRVEFNEVIGLFRTQSGTLGEPTTKALLHFGQKGFHFVPAKPF